MDNSSLNTCPICSRNFSEKEINDHVDKCLFLHSNETEANVSNTPKRDITLSPKDLHSQKKPKLESTSQVVPSRSQNSDNFLKMKKVPTFTNFIFFRESFVNNLGEVGIELSVAELCHFESYTCIYIDFLGKHPSTTKAFTLRIRPTRGKYETE